MLSNKFDLSRVFIFVYTIKFLIRINNFQFCDEITVV